LGVSVDVSIFERGYAAARDRFLSEAQEVGAVIEHHIHPTSRALDGSVLAIDTARVGPRDATHLFVILSGTHGLEGLSGSAAQSAFLRSLPVVPDFAAILFVHAANPYGVAHCSRGNEDNIDLNRNFVDHAEIQSDGNEVQSEVQALFAPENLDFQVMQGVSGASGALIEKFGPERVLNAATAGQYSFPKGLNFGGQSASWSNSTLRSIIRAHAASVTKAVFLDWHTGLGPYGELCYLCFNAPQSGAYQSASSWWGPEALEDTSAFETGDARPDYSGLLVQGLAEELPAGTESVKAVIEFGTYDNMEMLGALVTDRWLRFGAPQPLSVESEELKAWMIERFYPSDPAWRKAVLKAALEVQNRTFQGLLEWSD